MRETGQIEAGPGAVWKASAATDCALADYKVVVTSDKRVFVLGHYRGEVVEILPPDVRWRRAEHNAKLEIACDGCTVIWARVIQ